MIWIRIKSWHIVVLILLVFSFNLLVSGITYRFDMTSSGLYTLSERNSAIIKENKKRIIATLMMGNNIPASFKKLRNETEFFLSGLHDVNNKIWYDVFDPNLGTISQVNALRAFFKEKNINPTNIRVSTNDGVKETLIYPYVHIESGNQEIFVNILESKQSGETEEDAIFRSIQKLESKITKGIYGISKEQRADITLIAFGEYLPKKIYHLSSYLEAKYKSNISSPKDLYLKRDSIQVAVIPVSQNMDISKEDLLRIDQYIMSGGKILWLIEEYNITLDSIDTHSEFVPFYQALEVADLLFHNGVKLTGEWASDLRSSRIPQVIGQQGGRAQTELFNYPFHPVSEGVKEHVISSGLGEINMLYPTIIDTIFTTATIVKKPLVTTSEYSKRIKYPNIFSFEFLRKSPNVESFSDKEIMTAVLIQGKFDSYYKNRYSEIQIKELKGKGINYKEKCSIASSQIIITDQDMIMPGADRNGRLLPLGYNKWERAVFNDNEVFLNNALEYLINGEQFLLPDERSEYKMASLDKKKVRDDGIFWVYFNLIVPMFPLLFLYFGYSFYLKRKYG
ncbi:MAG: Gldg family protein [Saprospiraceae bacterium]